MPRGVKRPRLQPGDLDDVHPFLSRAKRASVLRALGSVQQRIERSCQVAEDAVRHSVEAAKWKQHAMELEQELEELRQRVNSTAAPSSEGAPSQSVQKYKRTAQHAQKRCQKLKVALDAVKGRLTTVMAEALDTSVRTLHRSIYIIRLKLLHTVHAFGSVAGTSAHAACVRCAGIERACDHTGASEEGGPRQQPRAMRFRFFESGLPSASHRC